MSIMQEYEQIKKIVGPYEWNRMLKFIEVSNGQYLLSDLIYNKDVYTSYENWREKQ